MALQFTGNRNAKMSSVVAIDWDHIIDRPGVVQYDIDQGLDATQREQARENIAAVGYDAQTLTSTQRRQARQNIGSSPVFNVLDYYLSSHADHTIAAQAAVDAAIAAGYGAVLFPGRGPYYVSAIDLTSDAYGHICVMGDAGVAQIVSTSTSAQPLFDCKGSVFKTHALSFKNMSLHIGSGNTDDGSVAFDVDNRQETVWDNVRVWGFREGIKLRRSWAPLITNNCYFNGILGKTVYATDNSFNSTRIFDSAFAGCGLSLSEPCVNVGPSSNVDIRGNDFSTNYCHIQFDNCSGASVTSYFEDSTLGNFEFVNTTGESAAINFIGCSLGAAGASVVKYVDGFNLIGNSMYNCALTYDATATRVTQFGNDLLGTATLGAPTYATSTQPFISSGSIEAFRYGLGGSQVVLYNDTGGGGDHTAIRSREFGATGSIAVGGSTDPTNYHNNTNHLFRSSTGGTLFARIQSAGLSLVGGIPLRLLGSTSGQVDLKGPAIAGASVITFPVGTTDFTATGGAGSVLRQSSAGGAITVSQLTASDLSDGVTGTGSIALSASPTFTGTILGAAATLSGSLVAQTLRVRTTFVVRGDTTTDGNVTGIAGDASTVGYFEWYKPGPTRIAYMGAGTGAATLDLQLNAVNFNIVGGAVLCAASTTVRPSLRIPSGTAPTSPTAGDFWYDGTSLKFRDNGGVTRSITWT